jgi:hypothetical protein
MPNQEMLPKRTMPSMEMMKAQVVLVVCGEMPKA